MAGFQQFIAIAPLVGALINSLNMVAILTPSWAQQYDEWRHSSSSKLNLDNELHERLKKSLLSVKGQGFVIDKIVDAICAWSESKKNSFDPVSGGLVIHMAGISGSGKSTVANILSNELSKNSAIKISYSSIDTNDPRSCAEQLFGSYTRRSAYNTEVRCNTRYGAQLIHNPEVVVQIDEFDKFMMRDDSMQALLWDVADTGRLKIDKDTYVDCSKTIFILTSNASRESLKMKLANCKSDDSDSLESVNFKQAFLNRITNVYFENFSKEIYREILSERLKPIAKYYSEKYGIELNFRNDTLDKISGELSNMKAGGARNIGLFTKKLYSAANAFKRENHISESSKNDKFMVDVTYNKGCFKLLKK